MVVNIERIKKNLSNTGWRKKNACFFFQIIITLFIFNIKKIMLTPTQPVINAVFITYIDYLITENYRVEQKESIAFWDVLWPPRSPHLSAWDFFLWGLPQIISLRSETSYSRRSESFHSRRNCNCATRNVSKCDAEL